MLNTHWCVGEIKWYSFPQCNIFFYYFLPVHVSVLLIHHANTHTMTSTYSERPYFNHHNNNNNNMQIVCITLCLFITRMWFMFELNFTGMKFYLILDFLCLPGVEDQPIFFPHKEILFFDLLLLCIVNCS